MGIRKLIILALRYNTLGVYSLYKRTDICLPSLQYYSLIYIKAFLRSLFLLSLNGPLELLYARDIIHKSKKLAIHHAVSLELEGGTRQMVAPYIYNGMYIHKIPKKAPILRLNHSLSITQT